MWVIIKFDEKKLSFLKEDFSKRLKGSFEIYRPKLLTQKYHKNKLINKELNLLGDYMFCFHEDFKNIKIINSLKYCRGLKYLLEGYKISQFDIKKFILNCKNSENNGYLSYKFYKLNLNKKYKFSSGPFVEKIFQIINLQKNKIDILMGNLKTTIKKKEFLFNPV